jgi:chaperonin GroES
MSYWQAIVRLAQEMIVRHCNIFELTFKSLIIMSKVNIQPLADRVLVEPAAAEEKTASGLFIPDTAKEKPQKGTVVAVGNGKKDEPLTVKVGDTVLYGKYAGTELSVDGHDYLIMREADIFAIL